MDRVRSVQELIERTRHMPLEKMRFFINEDRQEPRCFGIYHDDAADRWVVYKNKDNGARAVRYSGPDEGYAANELWMKINSEIELRRSQMAPKKKTPVWQKVLFAAFTAVMAALLGALIIHALLEPNRGYYVVNDNVYYYQSSDWYWYDDGLWYDYDAPDGSDWYADSYYGETYAFEDPSDSFENTEYYDPPSSSSDSDIFDSWDSGGTDWSSDW